MKKSFILFVLATILIVTGCGKGRESHSSSSNKTISGYVIDDPVAGTTIEIYDENGNLLAKKENATDKNGKFVIKFQKDSSNYYLIKSINGNINKKFYNFEFIAIMLNNNTNTLYITPYSTLIFNILKAQNLPINEKNIEYSMNLIKKLLGINDLNYISPEFSRYLQTNGINDVIKELTIDIINQKGDEKLASIFPKSKILQPTITINNQLPSNSNNMKIITATGTREVNNTSSLISAIVTDKNSTKIYAYSSNIPSLKGKINFSSTAMALIGMGLKEKYSIDNFQLQYIYDSIKNTNEYQNLINAIKIGYENNISLLNNNTVYENLKKIFYYINTNNLLENNVNTLSTKALNKIGVSKILLKTTHTEIFSYPFFKFNFKNASITDYNGNVEFSIENPAFVGYAFTTKRNYFSEVTGFTNELLTNLKNIYIPFAKLYKSEDYIKDIAKTYSKAYVNYVTTGQMNLNDDKPIKTLGKSEDTVYTLSPYNCGNNMKCWRGKFIAYDNGFVPYIYNSIYSAVDIISVVSPLELFRKKEGYVKFIKFLISFNGKLGEFKSMLETTKNALDILSNISFSELSNLLNNPQLYSAYKRVQSKINEIQKTIHIINNMLAKLKNIKEYNPNPPSADNEYVEEIFKAFSKGNFFKALEIAQQHNEKISDVFSLYINFLVFPDINYKGKLYSNKKFFTDKQISKLNKSLVQIAIMSKFLFPDDTKDPYKTLNKILESQQITIEWKKLDKGISPMQSLNSLFSVFDPIINYIESWSNRGCYIDKDTIENLGTLFLEWVKDSGIDLIANITEDNINAYLVTREIGKKALTALDVTTEGIQLGLMAGSYAANPKVLPYEIIAKENKTKRKMDFEARMAMDSIGLSKVYLLDSNGLIYGRELSPNTIIVKKGYSFYPSMEIVFPKNVLRDYLSHTLFTNSDWIYNFTMFIDKYGSKLDTAYVYGVGNGENTNNPGLLSVWYSALIGNNGAYISKISCPSDVINQIKTDGNNEYLDIYDLSTLDTPNAKVRLYDSNYISLNNSHPLVTLPDSGVYSIKMRTTIDQPYTAYINQKNVTYNTWEHSFKVIVLSPIDNDIKTLAQNYKFYKTNNNLYTMSFSDIAKKGNYYIIPVVDSKILPYNEGNLTNYALDNFGNAYAYFISKKNYQYLSSYDDGTIPLYLFDILAKNGIVYKMKLNLNKDQPPIINNHNIQINNLTATLSIQATDPDNDPITCSVDWGDGSSDEFNCDENITHTYSNYGEYNVIVTATDDKGLSDKTSFILNLQHKNSEVNNKSIVITENQLAKLTLSNIEAGSCDINFGDGYSENYDSCPTEIEHVYKKPGVYDLFITNSNSEKIYEKVIIVNNANPSYWDGYVASLNNYVEDNEKVEDFYKNGELYIEPSLSDVSYYWTNFKYVNSSGNFTNIKGNDFSLEARVKNSYEDGGIDAYDTSIVVYTDNGKSIGVDLMGDDWALPYVHIWAGDDKKDNLNELILDLSYYRVIKFVVKNQEFKIYADNKLLYTLPFTSELGNIVGFKVSFKGSGKLSYFKLFDGNGDLKYNEEF